MLIFFSKQHVSISTMICLDVFAACRVYLSEANSNLTAIPLPTLKTYLMRNFLVDSFRTSLFRCRLDKKNTKQMSKTIDVTGYAMTVWDGTILISISSISSSH